MLIESKITLKVKLFLKCDEIKSYVSSRRLVNLREDSIKRVKINGLIIENSYSRRRNNSSFVRIKKKQKFHFVSRPTICYFSSSSSKSILHFLNLSHSITLSPVNRTSFIRSNKFKLAGLSSDST